MDPIAKFIELFDRAKKTPGIHDATGMTLSTADAEGRPSGRVVLLKGIDADGLVFYTNTRSRKGRACAAQPWISLSFWWPQLESQVRFEGRAVRVTDAEADAYFATRPRESQIGAWASQQSEPLGSREELERRFEEVSRKYPKVVPRPPHWSGYRVAPLTVEFWWSRPGRLHERELHARKEPGAPWSLSLLNP